MPEKIIAKLKNNLLPQWKVCFLSAVIFGLIAHLYKITNWLPNWDSLVFRYDAQNMVALGRWFLPVVSAPSSYYDLPWLTGIMAILFYALGAVCICKIFNVTKKVTAALIGAAVVTFPTVTSVMLYNYVADAYALSFLLACISALLLVREKPRYIVAGILLALSVGIYQASVTVTVMLILCYMIITAIYSETKTKTLLFNALKYMLTGVGAMAVYYLILMAILKISATNLIDYQGFDSAMSFSSINILSSVFVVKDIFLNYFFDFSKGANAFSIINIVILAFTTVFYLCGVIKNKVKFSKLLFVLGCLILLPVGANALCFINSDVDYHNLMKMGYFVFYLFFILAYEKADFNKEKLNCAKLWTVLLVSAVLVFNQVVIANVSYHKLNMAYEKSFGILVRIADRIEQTENTQNCDTILVLGALEEGAAYSVNLPPDITGSTDGVILRADDEIVGQSVVCSAINDYCSKNYKFLAGEEKQAVLNKIDMNSLGTWPDKNCVCVVDNVIVLKLGDEKVK